MPFLQRVLLAFLAGWTTSAFIQAFGWFPLVMILLALAAGGFLFLVWAMCSNSSRISREEEEEEL